MIGQELKILFKQGKAYLTTDRAMTLEQLGLSYVKKTSKDSAYWIIKVLKYIEAEKKICCEVISYCKGDTNFEISQKLIADKLNDLQVIAFDNVDTDGLLKTLVGTSGIIRPNNHISVEEMQVHITEHVRRPHKITINETFYVPLKNVQFILGGVSFYKKFKEYKSAIEIRISNYDIREEFDAVKNYFANVLNTKKIEVTVNIEITDNEVSLIEAKSPEIDKINKQIIKNVKSEFFEQMIKKKINIKTDKNLFTLEDYFDEFTEGKINFNAFYTSDKELFKDMISSVSDAKHYNHLRFLSSIHSYKIMKLRFVLKPVSFMFLIQGDRNYHIVWETLDTEEATYVWHVEKDINVLKMEFRKVEDIINLIKVQGKTEYLNSTKDIVRRIKHDYSPFVNGFLKWKGELESILT